MTLEPRWLSKKVALAIHEKLLAQHGGKPGIINEGLLDAAMVAPRNHFAYERAPLFRLAAIYAHGLTQNHPFVDGNKRVALTVAGVFLEKNGLRLDAPESDAFAAMDALSSGQLSRDDFEGWLRSSCSPIRQVGGTPR
ncbi:MAG TPA: type II toxin-antitoxin system death-on-curing family toxin [Candidatus Binatia bacterium]|nr:type II toxin-antitoxin system death-on-curing family toxin [Candidatus Binatia bacterium]